MIKSIIKDPPVTPFALRYTQTLSVSGIVISERNMAEVEEQLVDASSRNTWMLYVNDTGFETLEIHDRFAQMVCRKSPAALVFAAVSMPLKVLQTYIRLGMRRGCADQFALRYAQLDSETMDWFIGALYGLSLDYLCLRDTFVGSARVATLVQNIDPCIRMLDLDGCKIGQEGFESLVDSLGSTEKGWPCLLSVRLGNNRITRLDPLPALLGACQRLQFVDFKGTDTLEDNGVPLPAIAFSIVSHPAIRSVCTHFTGISMHLDTKINQYVRLKTDRYVLAMLAFASRRRTSNAACPVHRLFPEVDRLLATYL